MSTPLYKRFKDKGSTFYAFPSSSMHPNPKFTKFTLLNIPNKIEDKRLDFENEDFNGNTFDIWTQTLDPVASYQDSLVESLRNYVANHDIIERDSRVNTTKDFYNIDEKQTPTEMIFWKWLRKLNVIDFEVAEHAVDWDKNMTDFDNPNADTISNTDYFRKILWTERQVIPYSIETIVSGGGTTAMVTISFPAKYRVGDEVIFEGDGLGSDIVTGITYELTQVGESETETIIYFEQTINTVVNDPVGTVKLNYDRVVQYIGEINAISDVHTSRKDETEVTAYIPHQAGSTPTVLFETRADQNYYPGLELPILPEQIQTEIKGAENLDSPIRQNPGDYPGYYYGQFDTEGKTYMASSGDKIRYSGDYYGVLRNNNVGISDDDFIFLMSDFDSSNLDGINLDFNLEHYLKMSITDEQVGFNFDEFNQLSIDGEVPQDFEYNVILWYYEVEGDDVNDNTIYTNLYGITFLNNPKNNEEDTTYIQPYEKLVSNDEQDGLSYIHTLNLSTSIDNDTSSMSFDPLAINNTFGFDLYQNVMSNVAKLNESFTNIITTFTKINEDINDMKSIIYTQTDIDLIKSKLKNLEELLKLYEQYQFVDSETVSITTNYGGVYPTISFNIKNVEYADVLNITTTDIYNYKVATGNEYYVEVPDSNKLLIRITNNDITDYSTLGIILDKDLSFKQSAEIYVDSANAYYANNLKISINYDNDNVGGTVKTTMIDNFYLPTDIGDYIPGDITYNKSYYNDTYISHNINLMKVEGTEPLIYTLLYPTEQNVIGSATYEEKVYMENFKFINDSTGELVDYSGIYSIGTTEADFNQLNFKFLLNTYSMTPVGVAKAYLPKAVKFIITRVDESNTSSIEDRYLIQKIYL
jgi:hypothetical protein